MTYYLDISKYIDLKYIYCSLQGQTIDDIPNSVLDDACQLVKANSIMGNKMNDIDIVYTMWSNLKKTPSMEVWLLFMNHLGRYPYEVHILCSQ